MKDLLDALADGLAGAGVKNAFGISGSGATWKLITALEARGVTYLNACHEASAAIMAGAATRASGRPAVSLSIKGPGLANAVGGIAFNHFECTPSISIAEAFGTETPGARMHKRLDQAAMLRPVVKRMCTLEESSSGIPALLEAAGGEVPGPVHVDLCMGAYADARTTPAMTQQPPAPLLARVHAAQRPVVIVGSLALRRAWGAQLAALRVPVFTTAAARGAVDETAPYSGGVYTGDGKMLAPEQSVIAASDLVVCLGLRCTEVTGARAPAAGAVGFEAISAAQLPLVPGMEATTACVADEVFEEVLALLAAREWGADEVRAALQKMRAALLAGPWLPAHCFAAVEAREGTQALVLDTGSFCTIGEHMWRAQPGRNAWGSNNGRFMGGGLPSAVGTAMSARVADSATGAGRTQPIFCALGDGGMQAYPAELKVLANERLPVCVLFMTDGRYGSIACAGSPGMARRAVDFAQPSWFRAAEAMNVPSVRCAGADSFERAVREWRADGPLFIECAFDPDAYLVMTRELR